MFIRPLHLYVSATSWLAIAPQPGPAGPAPAAGTFANIASADWKAIGQALHSRFGGVRREIHLVLSSRQCRFLVLPWSSAHATSASMRSYAAAAFAENFAIVGDSHHIEIDWPEFGDPILAVAYPRQTIDLIEAGLAVSGHVLDSVAASVEPVLRKYARTLGATACLLTYAEDDGITAITIEANAIVQIETPAEHGDGLDDMVIWASRKRLGFPDDNRMWWLASVAKPDAYPGSLLPLVGVEKPASAGHGILAACL
jgi:hypothetical protein